MRDAIGSGPANTLMTLVDAIDPDRLAAKDDLARLSDSIDQRFDSIDQRFNGVEKQLEKLNDRLWTLTLAFSAIMVTGFASVTAALITLYVTG